MTANRHLSASPAATSSPYIIRRETCSARWRYGSCLQIGVVLLYILLDAVPPYFFMLFWKDEGRTLAVFERS